MQFMKSISKNEMETRRQKEEQLRHPDNPEADDDHDDDHENDGNALEMNDFSKQNGEERETTANPMYPDNERKESVIVSVSEYADEIILDSITPNFSWPRFFQQLLSHVFIFLAPFLLDDASLQGFGIDSLQNIVVHIMLPCLVYVNVISYFFLDPSNLRVLVGALWFPLIYFVQHKLVVAVKYASLSETEYCRLIHVPNRKLYLLYQNQLQLITGWLNRDDVIIEFELNAACVRIGQTLCKIYFIIPYPDNVVQCSKLNQIRHWIALLRGRKMIDITVKASKELELVEVIKSRKRSSIFSNRSGAVGSPVASPTASPDLRLRKSANLATPSVDSCPVIPPGAHGGNKEEIPTIGEPARYYRLSAHDLCLTLIRRCDEMAKGTNNAFYYLTIAYNFINFIIPFIMLASMEGSVNWSDPALYIFLFSSSAINIFFGMVVYNLLYVAVFDVVRELFLFRDLSRLVRVTDLELQMSTAESEMMMAGENERASQSAKKRTAMLNNYSKKKISSILQLNKNQQKSKSGNIIEDENLYDDMDEQTMLRSMDDGLSNAGEKLAENNSPAEIPRLDFDHIEDDCNDSHTTKTKTNTK